MKPEVSIIMPVFNAENTVSRMIDSIISQTLSEWELICVDDGSTDKSGDILEKYAKDDNRIRVIHKQNEGVAAARQDGLDAARGEYIIHADADDWVDSSMLEDMVMQIRRNSSDLLIVDYYRVSKNENIQITQRPSSYEPFVVMRELFQHLHGSCCNKMVRKAVLDDKQVQFIRGGDFCEDTLFWIQLMSDNDIAIDYIPKAYYHYYVNGNSITQKYSYSVYRKTVLFIAKLSDFYPANEDKDKILRRWKLNVKFAALYGAKCFTSKEYRKIFPECNKYIMQYNTSLINRILMLLSIIPGLFSVATNMFRYKNLISGHQVFNADEEK